MPIKPWNLVSLARRGAYSSAMSLEGALEAPAMALEDQSARVRPYSEVPGPRQLPIIGNSWRFAPIIGRYSIEELDHAMLDLHRQFGPVVRVGGLIGHPDLVFAFSPAAIETAFRREDVLPHRPSMPSLSHYKRNMRREFFGGLPGVIGVHGELWDAFRAKVQQVMMQPSTARRFIGPLNDIADDFMDRISEMKDGNQELPDHFLYEIYKWALESIGRVALDTRLGCLQRDLPKDSEAQGIIDSINNFFWNVSEVELKFPVWRFYKTKAYKKYIGALDDFRELCMKHISTAVDRLQAEELADRTDGTERRKGKAAGDSLVESILRQHGDPKLAAVLALDLLLVGVDTTSVALSSTIYQLTQNPPAQQRLSEELQAVLPSPRDPLTAQALEKLPFLKACIKETLRMYPVILGNGRCLQADAIIGGYSIPKGTHVIFPHYVVSNDPQHVSEPQLFLPQRWLKASSSTCSTSSSSSPHPDGCPHHAKVHPFTTLPFGYGRRTCLGKRFAEAELQIMLAKIFRKYQVDYNYGPLTYRVSPTYVPVEPLKFKLTPRPE